MFELGRIVISMFFIKSLLYCFNVLARVTFVEMDAIGANRGCHENSSHKCWSSGQYSCHVLPA